MCNRLLEEAEKLIKLKLAAYLSLHEFFFLKIAMDRSHYTCEGFYIFKQKKKKWNIFKNVACGKFNNAG